MIESSLHNSNDKLFKLALKDIVVAKEFFNAHLPKHILERIDLSTLKLEKDTFIDPAFKETEADVVYSLKVGGSSGYLYTLVEQQSSVDSMMAFRLLGYIVRIIELHLKQNPESKQLPLVIPMVIYAGDDLWHAPLEIFPLFGELEALARETFLKPCQFIDVNRISDEVLREQLLSGLVAFTLKYRKATDFKRFLKTLMPWIQEVEVQGLPGASLNRIVLKYVIARIRQGDKDLLIQEAQQHLTPVLRGDIMTIAQQWEAEGIQKGEAAILTRLIRRRFGDIPNDITQRITKADAETLLLWGDKILDATNLEEIFAEDTEE